MCSGVHFQGTNPAPLPSLLFFLKWKLSTFVLFLFYLLILIFLISLPQNLFNYNMWKIPSFPIYSFQRQQLLNASFYVYNEVLYQIIIYHIISGFPLWMVYTVHIVGQFTFFTLLCTLGDLLWQQVSILKVPPAESQTSWFLCDTLLVSKEESYWNVSRPRFSREKNPLYM